jgi:Ferritin-like
LGNESRRVEGPEGFEVEHALSAQYLYAGYSLGGPQLSEEQQKLVRQWHDVIVQIAREESEGEPRRDIETDFANHDGEDLSKSAAGIVRTENK